MPKNKQNQDDKTSVQTPQQDQEVRQSSDHAPGNETQEQQKTAADSANAAERRQDDANKKQAAAEAVGAAQAPKPAAGTANQTSAPKPAPTFSQKMTQKLKSLNKASTKENEAFLLIIIALLALGLIKGFAALHDKIKAYKEAKQAGKSDQEVDGLKGAALKQLDQDTPKLVQALDSLDPKAVPLTVQEQLRDSGTAELASGPGGAGAADASPAKTDASPAETDALSAAIDQREKGTKTTEVLADKARDEQAHDNGLPGQAAQNSHRDSPGVQPPARDSGQVTPNEPPPGGGGMAQPAASHTPGK